MEASDLQKHYLIKASRASPHMHLSHQQPLPWVQHAHQLEMTHAKRGVSALKLPEAIAAEGEIGVVKGACSAGVGEGRLQRLS